MFIIGVIAVVRSVGGEPDGSLGSTHMALLSHSHDHVLHGYDSMGLRNPDCPILLG